MKLGAFRFSIARFFLNRSQKAQLKKQPSLDSYKTFFDVAPFDDAPMTNRYDVICAKTNPLGITLIDIHGGAYVTAERKNNHGFMEYFVKKGFDSVLLDYPLNDGKQGVDDQVRALVNELNHLLANLDEYGIGKHLFLTGDSAGGHFACLLAEAFCDEKLANKLGLQTRGHKLSGVLLNCPVYDFGQIGMNSGLTNGTIRLMFGPMYFDKEKVELHDPRAHVNSLTCPVFISSCKRDFLIQQYLTFCGDAEKLGLDVTKVFLDVDDPKVAHVHNILDLSEEHAVQVNDAMAKFMSDKG